jgi:pyruvate-ferredoxin/flavodoxin oxidoreductase
MLQSKAGVENKDYTAQKALLAKVEKGELTRDDLLNRGKDILNEEVATMA